VQFFEKSKNAFQEQIAERELLAGNIINKGKKDSKSFENESKNSQSGNIEYGNIENCNIEFDAK